MLRANNMHVEPRRDRSLLKWRWSQWLVFATIPLALGLRLINLDALPGELYGDIAIVHTYVADILAGRWPTYFVLSAGPLYHYLIAPIVAVFGNGYLGLKLASGIVSLAVLAVAYALGRELGGQRLALTTTLIAGFGSWLLVFSRLGNSQILVPLLTTGALWLAIVAARRGSTAHLVSSAIVAALGLYTYPQSFVLPPVILVVLLILAWTHNGIARRQIWIFVIVTLLCAVPFALIVARDPGNFFTGYIGGKLAGQRAPWRTLLGNIGRGLLAFNVRGDVVFRSNPSLQPHLDPISGVFFLAGIVFWLRPAQRRIGLALIAAFVLLQVPSWLVLSNPAEVPSASRSLGVAPLAYLFAASGLLWLFDHLRVVGQPLRFLAAAGIVAAMLILNVDRYFVHYAAGLPNNNTPFGRIIAEYVRQLPPTTDVIVVGCCWGDWGQPEPGGIAYAFADRRTIDFVKPDDLTCALLEGLARPAEIIWRPDAALPSEQVQACTLDLKPVLYGSRRGDPVFYSAALP